MAHKISVKHKYLSQCYNTKIREKYTYYINSKTNRLVARISNTAKIHSDTIYVVPAVPRETSMDLILVGDDVIIGEGCKIMGGAVLSNNCKVGQDCRIFSHVTLKPNVQLADNIKVRTGATIWDDVSIGRRTFIGSKAIIHKGSKIGSEVQIGRYADVPADTVIEDNVQVPKNFAMYEQKTTYKLSALFCITYASLSISVDLYNRVLRVGCLQLTFDHVENDLDDILNKNKECEGHEDGITHLFEAAKNMAERMFPK